MDHFDPVCRTISIDLSIPTISDNRSHELRVRAALESILGQLPLLPLKMCKSLSDTLISSDYEVKVLVVDGPCGWEISRIISKNRPLRTYGLAIDLGSTTVVFYLVDLGSGKIKSILSKPNPQHVHGKDILERIFFAKRGNGLDVLQSEIIDLFNASIQEITAGQGLTQDDIYFITLAGNTTMCHFFLGLDPGHICREPYIPVVNRLDLIRPNEIGINIHPQSWLYCFPNVGSYFGGDLLADILVSGLHLKEEISMLMDIGTNAEIVLGNKDWLMACAGAAGPALEGGILSCGMDAQPGAIDSLEINPKNLTVSFHTKDGIAPKGLCGSGIIDLLAAMFITGLIDPTGKLLVDRDRARMRYIDGELAYIIANSHETGHGKPVYISQSDIKNLIRSKAAMYTILNIVIRSVGIDFKDIEKFYIAGSFGNYVNPQKAIIIGMLPDVPLERFESLGNAAGAGAIKALTWRQTKKEVDKICNKITYLEMNVHKDFMSQLTSALFLPHTDLTRFPSVHRMMNEQLSVSDKKAHSRCGHENS